MPDGKRPPVLIYRDTLGALTETFIPAQVEAMSHFRGYYTGTTIREDFPLDSRFVIRPSSSGSMSALSRSLFRVAGHIPNEWKNGIRRMDPLLIHAHFGPDGAWAIPLARQFDLPLVVTFWGHDITVSPAASLGYRFYRSVLLPRIFAHADLILGCSRWIETLLLDAGAPADKVRVHYAGTDTARFRPHPSRTREDFVLFTGRLVEKKGVEYLLDAMAIVQQQHREARLVIAGDGPLRDALEARAAALNIRVEFRGSQSHDSVLDLMQRALILVVPSVTASTGDAEGLPLTLLEGQSTGIPVVATQHSGIPEAVADGVSGVLVPERNHEALANAIIGLLADPDRRFRMGQAARHLMTTNFDLRLQAAKLESMYQEILARRSIESDRR